MKKIVVEVVADDDVANDMLDEIVTAYLYNDVASLKSEHGSASVTVTDEVRYGCHRDEDLLRIHHVCLIDQGVGCIHAQRIKRKEDCQYWRPVNEN